MTNAEFNNQFCERTQRFAIRILQFVESLPFNTSTKILGTQLLRAGTSVGSNFRAFTRARSHNERFAKICIVVEESDETPYWLDLFMVSQYGDKEEIKSMLIEGEEILKVCSKIKNSLYK